MAKQIKSHVQIPKAILKNFSFREYETNENNKPVKCDMVHLLDLNNQTLRKENIKSLDTVKGYYSHSMESFLGTHIEGRLGNLMKNAKNSFQQQQIPM